MRSTQASSGNYLRRWWRPPLLSKNSSIELTRWFTCWTPSTSELTDSRLGTDPDRTGQVAECFVFGGMHISSAISPGLWSSFFDFPVARKPRLS